MQNGKVKKSQDFLRNKKSRENPKVVQKFPRSWDKFPKMATLAACTLDIVGFTVSLPVVVVSICEASSAVTGKLKKVNALCLQPVQSDVLNLLYLYIKPKFIEINIRRK